MAKKKIIGLYPGSFDPVTNGHLDIAQRAHGICDQLHIAVVANPSKKVLFSVEERVEFLEKTTRHLPNAVISSFNGLLVDYARLAHFFVKIVAFPAAFANSGKYRNAAVFHGDVVD